MSLPDLPVTGRIAFIETSQSDLIDTCRKIIALDSSPTSSTVELVDYLAARATEAGLIVEVMREVQSGVIQANIIIRIEEFKAGDREFLLQTHLDTVDPGNFSLWKKNDFNPYDAVIEDSKIYGLGAAEIKLDFLCKLNALIKFKNKKFNALKPVLIGTFGEETGMQGALKLIRKNKINAKYALIGEASDLNIIKAAKGFAVVEIRIPISEDEKKFKISKNLLESATTQTRLFSGRAAHSSTPHLGDNAIQKMLEFLQKIPDNMVIIEVDGGTRFNMIPSQAMVELELVSHVKNLCMAKLNKIYRALQEVENDMKQFQDNEFNLIFQRSVWGLFAQQTTVFHLVVLVGYCRISHRSNTKLG